MALHQFLCGLTVVVALSLKGCQSQVPTCGVAAANTKILGGQDASPGSWPWQARLEYPEGALCSASLISNQWVLTAAHCISYDFMSVMVLLGSHTLSGPNPDEVVKISSEAHCHPGYDLLTQEHDICLLKLASPVTFTDAIFPICLAAAGSTFHNGTSSWVAGWGFTGIEPGFVANVLQEVNVPIVGNGECSCAHPSLTENMICAGVQAGGKDACLGDSGGPLMSKQVFQWVQSGIVSFGFSCGLPLSPGVYTRVSQYQDWITNITGSSKPTFVRFNSSGDDGDWNATCPTLSPFITPTPPTPTPVTCEGEDCKEGGSVFDSGENMIHFSLLTRFGSLCVLLLSLHVLVGDV